MQLFVRAEGLHALSVTGEETAADAKLHVAEAQGVSPNDLVLYYNGTPLADEHALAKCAELATLVCEARLLGGKVHGSLARAGKVKGQTPKVDKQEKKKKQTGRAKRRAQYNRRFVTAASAFGGRRKGP